MDGQSHRLRFALEMHRRNVEWDMLPPPRDDKRVESRRLHHHSLTIAGSLAQSERYGLVAPMVKESLEEEVRRGRSFAFIRPSIRKFIVERKSGQELEEERQKFDTAAKQADLFLAPIVPYQPCPYRFKYEYETKDGKRQAWDCSPGCTLRLTGVPTGRDAPTKTHQRARCGLAFNGSARSAS